MNGATPDRTTDPYEPSKGALHAVGGVVCMAVAGLLFANQIEDPELFGSAAFVSLGTGFYLLGAGAVARGIQLSKR